MNYSDSIKAILLAAINDLSKTPEKYQGRCFSESSSCF